MSTLSPRPSVAAKLAVAVSVAVIVLAGIWISGGLITNDFGLPMALTAALDGAGGGRLRRWWRGDGRAYECR